MKVLFIRHCATKMNINNSWCGCSDVPLSEEGIEQLKQIKEIGNKYKVDCIYCSPLSRARITAEALSNGKTPIIIDPLLIERDFGKLEGKPCSEKDKNDMANWELNTDLGQGVEKIQDMYYKRLLPFINKLSRTYNADKTIAIVSHSWIGRLISFYVSNMKDFEIIYKKPKHCFAYEYNQFFK